MKYTEKGDRVTLEMTRDDFGRLLQMMGAAVGTASRNDPDLAAAWLEFVNRLNDGNPNFAPYEIPKGKGDGR